MPRSSPLVVFAYDFPHGKTYEGLSWLHAHGVEVSAVIGAPHEQLNIRDSKIRVGPAKLIYPSPREVCRRLKILYVSMPHRSADALSLLRKMRPALGVVLGARILPQTVIDCFSVGILNMHPGLIPENRGLDNVKWAILHGINQGVTSHLIAGGKDVDLGRLIERRIVPVQPDDTLLDIHLRLMNAEMVMMTRAIDRVNDGDAFPVFPERGPYRSAVPPEEEAWLMERFEAYKAAR